jgi:hypothetical protein
LLASLVILAGLASLASPAFLAGLLIAYDLFFSFFKNKYFCFYNDLVYPRQT